MGVRVGMGSHLEGPSRGPGGGADLAPGPRAAQEGGLAGHGLPPQGVQDPVLLKLGNVLQGVPGAVAGGSRECPLAGAVALGVRGPYPGPALSLPAGLETPRGVTVACTCVQPPCDPPSPSPKARTAGVCYPAQGGAQATVCQHALLVSVAPLPAGGVQLEQLRRPGHQVLLALSGPLPLCLLQGKLLPRGFVLVTLADGPGDVLPEPASGAHALSWGTWAVLSPHARGEPQSNLHLVASSDRELTASQGARVSWALLIYPETVLSYAGRTPTTSRALPVDCRSSAPEPALPQASPALPPGAHSWTCPLPRRVHSGPSSLPGTYRGRASRRQQLPARPPAGIRGPAAPGPHLSDSSSVCSSRGTVCRFSRRPRISSLGFQKSSAPPLPSSLMNTSLSCPRRPGGSEVPAVAAAAPGPTRACPEAASHPVSREPCQDLLARRDLPGDLVEARAAPEEGLRGHTRDDALRTPVRAAATPPRGAGEEGPLPHRWGGR